MQKRGDESARSSPTAPARRETGRGPAGTMPSEPRSPRRRSRCRSCGTTPCAAKHQAVADRRSPPRCRPKRHCRARARTRHRGRGRPKPIAADQRAAAGRRTVLRPPAAGQQALRFAAGQAPNGLLQLPPTPCPTIFRGSTISSNRFSSISPERSAASFSVRPSSFAMCAIAEALS